jgi:hypothetical protein
VSDPIEELRRECRFEAASDVIALLKGVRQLDRPGAATVVLLDQDRRPVELFVVEDGDSELRTVVSAVGESDIADVTDMVLVTDRTGDDQVDQPDDELTWMELVELAGSYDIALLDWFVVWGRYAYSVSEHAPIPAQW